MSIFSNSLINIFSRSSKNLRKSLISNDPFGIKCFLVYSIFSVGDKYVLFGHSLKSLFEFLHLVYLQDHKAYVHLFVFLLKLTTPIENSKQVAAEIVSSAALFYAISVTSLLTKRSLFSVQDGLLNHFHCRCLGVVEAF